MRWLRQLARLVPKITVDAITDFVVVAFRCEMTIGENHLMTYLVPPDFSI